MKNCVTETDLFKPGPSDVDLDLEESVKELVKSQEPANEKPGAEEDTGEEVKIEFGLIVIARSHDAPSERCSTGFVSMKNIQPLISNEILVKK